MPIALKKPTSDSPRECVLFLDPSVNKTGYSIYHVVHDTNAIGYRTKLINFGLVESGRDDTTTQRIRQIIRLTNTLWSQYECSHAVIEVPPSTMYGFDVMTKEQIVARCQSVFKTVAIAHTLYHDCLSRCRSAMSVLPVQWEPGRKERAGVAIKEYNVREANRLCSKHGFKAGLKPKTKDENTADAIVMGDRLIHFIMQGKEFKED